MLPLRSSGGGCKEVMSGAPSLILKKLVKDNSEGEYLDGVSLVELPWKGKP